MSTERSTPMIEVKDLRKWFPIHAGVLSRRVGEVKAVDGVSFNVGRKETLSIVGESGCGKTTAGRALLRLIEPTGGSALYRSTPDAAPVDLFQLSQEEMRARRDDLQIIFQDPYGSLNPRITVGNAIGEPLAVRGLAEGSELQDRVEELLKLVGLRPEVANRYPHEFSGGQRQRISIARALSFNGLESAAQMLAINAGTHAGPLFSGDTIYAWSEVLDKATLNDTTGALRLRLVAAKNHPCTDFPLRGEDGKYAGNVILDFDYWAAIPI